MAVVAVADHRRASPNARIRLCAPATDAAPPVRDVEGWLSQQRERFERFLDRLARASGQPIARIREDVTRGRSLDAREAVRYGLIDEVVARP